MGRVFVIGSINNDVVVQAQRHPKTGETLHGTALNYYPGGKGANQAVASARAGAKTYMVGLVGQDSPGKNLVEFLASSDVDTTHVMGVSAAPTGTAIITVAHGDNTIIVVGGANAELSERYLPDTFTHQDIIVAQFETPISTTQVAFKRAKDIGAITVLNPAPADTVPTDLLALTDYLVVNEHEFELIFKQAASLLLTDVKRADLLGDYAGTVIVTLGKDGVLFWSSETKHHQSGIAVDVVDSTGAGDCFVGYFAAGLAQGETLENTLNLANAAAALSVTRAGAAISIPQRAEAKF